MKEAGFHDPFLTTPDSIITGAATLRAAGFRSTMAYVDIAVQEFIRRGGTRSQQIDLAIRDTRRACARGQGAPKHAEAFPVARIPELPGSRTPWVRNGPMWPRRTLTCGVWWLTREIELSNAVLGDISRPDPDSVRWNFPASKSDPRALGMARKHKCACGKLNSGFEIVDPVICPACNLWTQVLEAREFCKHIVDNPDFFDDDLSCGNQFPLFPTDRGTFPDRSSMVSTIVHAACKLNIVVEIEGNQFSEDTPSIEAGPNISPAAV